MTISLKNFGRFVVHILWKVMIETIRRFCCANFGFKLCAVNARVAQVLALSTHRKFNVCDMHPNQMRAHCEVSNTGQKPSFPPRSRARCKGVKLRNELLFAWSILATDVSCSIFSFEVIPLSWLMLGRWALMHALYNFLGEIWGLSQLEYPWIGCLLIHTLCTLLSTIQGLLCRSKDCYAMFTQGLQKGFCGLSQSLLCTWHACYKSFAC